MPYRILTLNRISERGLARFAGGAYEVGERIESPDAILVRSADMHSLALPATLLAVARAGAGTNNIPVEALSRRGVPVFNTPGANANAVKELVLAGLLLAARNLFQAWEFTRGLSGDDAAIELAVERDKGRFVGFELPGRTLGVIGLGAVGVLVANAAEALGMRVLGYDPQLTVQRAWQLSSHVQQAASLDDLCARSDVVSIHVPLVSETRALFNRTRIAHMRRGALLLNFARAPIVDSGAVLDALQAGQLHAYVCDFPSAALREHPRVIALPHLGASTLEAEDNCAIAAVESLREFLELGHVRNSVNFPDAALPRQGGAIRIAIANDNIPNMVGQISTCLAEAHLNIAELLNRSRGEHAYTLIDAEGTADERLLQRLGAIQGVRSVRLVHVAE
ncbi:MAG TPA: phosphoglycerate dehydrogenase [Steroidobacteraceae bacterium]|nr:phosphoglycerate dehydrogenase [Steroidobacteraceae bacterium]